MLWSLGDAVRHLEPLVDGIRVLGLGFGSVQGISRSQGTVIPPAATVGVLSCVSKKRDWRSGGGYPGIARYAHGIPATTASGHGG